MVDLEERRNSRSQSIGIELIEVVGIHITSVGVAIDRLECDGRLGHDSRLLT